MLTQTQVDTPIIQFIYTKMHIFRWKVGGWKPLLTLWYAFNILAMAGFGFIHQAGVMPIQRDIGALDHGGVPYVNLVYSHTYMAPR